METICTPRRLMPSRPPVIVNPRTVKFLDTDKTQRVTAHVRPVDCRDALAVEDNPVERFGDFDVFVARAAHQDDGARAKRKGVALPWPARPEDGL